MHPQYSQAQAQAQAQARSHSQETRAFGKGAGKTFCCGPSHENNSEEDDERDDINRYQLPPDFTKASDSRSPAFIAKYGDIAVELDALPVTVLRDRLVNEVELRMDLAALAAVRKVEKADRVRLAKALHRR
jgi:hypothetical protein